MEKVMSVEDKIRRAEEIYYRRREQGIPTREEIKKPVKGKKNIKLFTKMIKQIIICLLIYSVFYIIVNNNYIFSSDFTNKAKEILSQDINFSEIYSFIMNKINEEQGMPDEENVIPQDETKQEDTTKEEIQNNNENIGGAEEIPTEEEQIVETTAETDVEQTQVSEEPVLSQMEQDANYIKSTISFIKPVSGTISSMFRDKKSYNCKCS